MNYHIHQENSKPAYLQLYECLKHDIITGAFFYGAKMPSKRTLAEDTGVSVITVQHAYEILCEEGYLEGRQRSGYFAIYKDSDFVSVADGNSTELNAISTENEAEQSDKHASGHGNKKKSVFPFSVLSKTMRKVLLDYGDDILVKSKPRLFRASHGNFCLFKTQQRHECTPGADYRRFRCGVPV